MKFELNELYTRISKETGIPKNRIELVFKSMFELIAETMREKKGDNILLPKFGKFVVPLKKLKYVNTKKYNQQFSRYYRRLEEPGNKES
jgi:nucleoid DNA-binding protein